MRTTSPTTTKAASATVAFGLVLMLCLPASAGVGNAVTMLQDAGQIGGRPSVVATLDRSHEPAAHATEQSASSEEALPAAEPVPAHATNTIAPEAADDCRSRANRRGTLTCNDPLPAPSAYSSNPRAQRSAERYRQAMAIWESLRTHGPSRAARMALRHR
ncbi:MAG: hypothetical protein IT537_14990 [Hyphomicrobiales bacterium]|nr:hypothetical protein [Hyphomicrobiales bacterium]